MVVIFLIFNHFLHARLPFCQKINYELAAWVANHLAKFFVDQLYWSNKQTLIQAVFNHFITVNHFLECVLLQGLEILNHLFFKNKLQLSQTAYNFLVPLETFSAFQLVLNGHYEFPSIELFIQFQQKRMISPYVRNQHLRVDLSPLWFAQHKLKRFKQLVFYQSAFRLDFCYHLLHIGLWWLFEEIRPSSDQIFYLLIYFLVLFKLLTMKYPNNFVDYVLFLLC